MYIFKLLHWTVGLGGHLNKNVQKVGKTLPKISTVSTLSTVSAVYSAVLPPSVMVSLFLFWRFRALTPLPLFRTYIISYKTFLLLVPRDKGNAIYCTFGLSFASSAVVFVFVFAIVALLVNS